MALTAMRNPRQYYAWGSPHALVDLLGIDNSGERPLAEIWMGAHPNGPSELLLPEGARRLDELVNEEPSRWLGRGAQQFGGEFPFLLKLLSAQRALSIQAHPSRAQAEAGFAAEEAAGVARDARTRNYRDRNHKPEMMVALERFYGLCGFREPGEIEANIAGYLQQVGAPADSIALPGRHGLEGWFREWMGLGEDTKAAILERAVTDCDAAGGGRESPNWWVSQLSRQYPGDFGALAPLYLNLVVLEPGEALFLGPGMLHAYLEGSGVEIMANSDNVLRAGCTEKHVDVEELIKVLSFEPGGAEQITPVGIAPGVELFRTAAPEFELLRVSLDGDPRRIERGSADAPMILFALAGRLEVCEEGGEAHPVTPGESLFVTPGGEALEVRGAGTLCCATVSGGFAR
ncbi:MAG: mannose-6-phosphate isomerase, class I [Alkalispirochaetaceae bacterium]